MRNESIPAREAFKYFQSLPPEQRSFAHVAREMGVPDATVRGWARDYRWHLRLEPLTKAQRLDQLRRRAERELEKDPEAKEAQAWLDVLERIEELARQADDDDAVDVTGVWTDAQLRVYQMLHNIARRKLAPVSDAELRDMLTAAIDGDRSLLDRLAHDVSR